MLIRSQGFKINKFFIPPFELKKGDLMGIYLYGGSHYYELEMGLADIFTAKKKNDAVEVYQPLTFVKHFIEPMLRRKFYPVTIDEYIRKNSKDRDKVAEKIYSYPHLTAKTKVQSLDSNFRKLLSLYSTLTYTNNIVFDLVAQDPIGAKETFDIVKENVENGGTAILIDWVEDMMKDCTKFISVELEEKN